MLAYIKPICISNFYVFKEYELFYFGEPKDNKDIFGNTVLPTEHDYELFSEITDTERQSINLTGVLSTIAATKEALSIQAKHKSLNTYNPLEDTPELYTELAKLDPLNEKDLLKFASEYGLPTNIVSVELTEELDFDNTGFDPKYVTNDEMDILTFAQSLKEYKEAFNLWNAINENEMPILKHAKEAFKKKAIEANRKTKHDIYKRFLAEDYDVEDLSWDELEDEETKPNFYQLLEYYINNKIDSLILYEHSLWRSWNETKDKSLQQIAKKYLIHLLNSNESGQSSFAIQNNEIVPGVRFDDLLEVAFFQLSEAVTHRVKFRRCAHCRSLFEVTHEGRKFCPPLPGRKRSTCENTYNQRLKRERLKKQ
ncbi:hypothetical protein [Bacillus nitroreducens]